MKAYMKYTDFGFATTLGSQTEVEADRNLKLSFSSREFLVLYVQGAAPAEKCEKDPKENVVAEKSCYHRPKDCAVCNDQELPRDYAEEEYLEVWGHTGLTRLALVGDEGFCRGVG